MMSKFQMPICTSNSRILDIATYLPDGVLTNESLANLYPDWPAEKIYSKTGIRLRHIVSKDQTATDLACEAGRALFSRGNLKPSDIDFLIFCTQAPDYILPTSACLLQDRLGIPRSCGALDINLGCSGYVYGLSLAKGLIESGSANCVLLITADTYSKFIHPLDKSVRTLFGDGAAATVVVADASEGRSIGPFVFGTDGRGAKNLMVKTGGARHARDHSSATEEVDASGNVRTADNLYMNGAEIMAFSLSDVPKAVESLLAKANCEKENIDYFVMHQANRFMLEALRRKLGISPEKLPIYVEECGNTVSSSIPFALEKMREHGQLVPGVKLMLVGFGVGYSWAGCLVNY